MSFCRIKTFFVNEENILISIKRIYNSRWMGEKDFVSFLKTTRNIYVAILIFLLYSTIARCKKCPILKRFLSFEVTLVWNWGNSYYAYVKLKRCIMYFKSICKPSWESNSWRMMILLSKLVIKKGNSFKKKKVSINQECVKRLN